MWHDQGEPQVMSTCHTMSRLRWGGQWEEAWSEGTISYNPNIVKINMLILSKETYVDISS